MLMQYLYYKIMIIIRRNRQTFKYLIFGLFFSLFSLIISNQFSLKADTCTWDGDTDEYWTTASNWDCAGGIEEFDTLVFPLVSGSTSIENDFAAGTQFNGIRFEWDVYDVVGNSITIDNNAIEFDDDDNSGTLDFGLDIDVPGAYLDLKVYDESTTLNLYGDISGTGDVWKYEPGAIEFGGYNTYDSITRITSGKLILRTTDALQNTDLEINSGAALEIENDITIDTSSIQVDGSGFYGDGSGAIKSISGNNTISSNIILAGEVSFFGVDSGTLTLTGEISGSAEFVKVGEAPLIISGSVGNINTGDFSINEGTVELNKDSGLAVPSDNIFIGDASGDIESAWLIVRNDDQFNSSAYIEVQADGILAYGDDWQTNNIADLNLQGGRANLAGNTNITNSLIIEGGSLRTYFGNIVISADTVDCSSGEIVGDPFTFVGDVTIDTNSSEPSTTCYVDSVIGGSNNITIIGKGVEFTNANTFTGGVLVTQEGRLILSNSLSLGEASGTTTVEPGSVLALGNGITINDEPLTISGQGGDSSGALASISGNNTYAGPITITGGDLNISTHNNSVLTLSGGVSGTITGPLVFIKTGTGDGLIQLANANPFTATGININNVVVRKTASVNVFPDTLLVSINSLGSLDLNSFAETLGALSGEVGSAITLGNATLSLGANNNSSTFAGVISGNGGITKIGTGVSTFSGNNLYTGTTNITSGKLLVNGLQSPSNVSLNSTGVLGGSGRVGVITGGGTGGITPGNSPGILNVTGNVAFASTNSFNVELNGTTVGTQYDQLNVTGSVNLNSATLNVVLGFTPTSGDSFTIIQSSAVLIGTFSGLPNGSTFSVGGNTLRIDYGTNSVVISVDSGGGSGGTGGSNGNGSGNALAETGVAIPLVALAFLTATTTTVVIANKYGKKRKRLKQNFR